MIKTLVVAALAASVFALPTIPANAAPILSDEQANCLIFPMLKKECWELGAKGARDVRLTVASQTEATAERLHLPLWWKCKPAEKGSAYLLTC